MADRIMLTPDELRARAREIRKLKEADEVVLGKMTNLVSSLCTVWRGTAQDGFVNQYTKGREDFMNLHRTLDYIAGMLEQTAAGMERTDNGLRSSIERI